MYVDLGTRHFMGAPEVLFDSLVRCVEATRTRYDEIIPGMRSRLESIIKTSFGLNPYEISLQQFSRAWCIRWLCFHDEHRLEAMYQANMLCRDLIMEQQQKDDEIYIIMSFIVAISEATASRWHGEGCASSIFAYCSLD